MAWKYFFYLLLFTGFFLWGVLVGSYFLPQRVMTQKICADSDYSTIQHDGDTDIWCECYIMKNEKE